MWKEPTAAWRGRHFSRLSPYLVGPSTDCGIGIPGSTSLIGDYLEFSIKPILGDFTNKGDIMLNRMKSVERIMRGRILANFLVEILSRGSWVVLECQGLRHFARIIRDDGPSSSVAKEFDSGCERSYANAMDN